jgi:plastocyanin
MRLIFLFSILLIFLVLLSTQIISSVSASMSNYDESLPKLDSSNSEIEDMIKSNFLTYTNQTSGIVLKYPDYWTISTAGNNTLAMLPPIEFSGLLINKTDARDLDEFLYERINLQRNSLQGFQLIETREIGEDVYETPLKLLLYLFNQDKIPFRAAELFYNDNSNQTYRISFVSKANTFDTIAPTVNKILSSMTIFEKGKRADLNATFKNSTINQMNRTNTESNVNSTLIESRNVTVEKQEPEQEPLISILSGASSLGNQAYSPDPLTVSKENVITITNNDNAPHTITSGEDQKDSSERIFDTDIMLPGSNATIDTSDLDIGEYPYHCEIHPFMKGLIIIE